MKLLIFSDNHFCERYSILTKFGTKYYIRLENQLESLNWIENLAIEKNCDLVLCAGDFFDKPQLTDQELTAIRDIKWNGLPHYFLVGNHESEENDLQFNSTKALEGPNRFVKSSPELVEFKDCEIAFLPYIPESNKKELTEYFPPLSKKYRLLLSHNDLFGLQMGLVTSKTGFKPDDLANICSYCVNGHLHNGYDVNKKVTNIGNLTGKDFGENADIYRHGALIIDTVTGMKEFIDNPYAFNFYRLEINNLFDAAKLKHLKNNAVVSLKCRTSLVEEVQKILKEVPTIIDSRMIVIRDQVLTEGVSSANLDSLTMDHLTKFVECCKEKIENSALLDAELAEVLK